MTCEEKYRIRYLLFTPFSYEEQGGLERHGNEQATALRSGNGSLIARYDIKLDDSGALAGYRRLSDGEGASADGRIFYAYLEQPHTSPRYNGYTYVNTMDRAAIKRFTEITHEAYFKEIGDRFGSTVPAIFTDEPQFTHKQTLKFATSLEDVALPFTDDFDDTYREMYGESLLDKLPELIWELPNGVSATRYRYHDHACERFASAFADTIGEWCDAHGIALTGHMMKEPTLGTQTGAVGEAMRSLRAFALPGIDMLADRREYTTAKQAASVAHQYGREGVLSELYGVTDWDFDFRGHKLQGDWQAALGVSVRVPHLSWVSMEGEAKRDYPASINYQSPWHEKYSLVEDHFARINTAMTRGEPMVHIGVIHPIESYWLHWGPADRTALVRDTLDRGFQDLTEWLLFGSVDFDFISESLLPDLCPQGGAPLTVGKMRYDVIIVPACETLRRTTYDRLSAFKEAGGRLIFMGDAPKYLDAIPSSLPAELCRESEHIGFSRGAILGALANARDIDIRRADGSMSSNLLHRLCRDGNSIWLFVAQGKQPYNKDVSQKQKIKIILPYRLRATLYDTLTGEIRPYPTVCRNASTEIEAELWIHDSLLLRLDYENESTVNDIVSANTGNATPATTERIATLPLPPELQFELADPNVLLLDRAEFSMDGSEFEPCEELLRVDTLLRRRLGWTPWGGSANQPWCLPAEPPIHRVTLRFTINSSIPLDNTRLALENAETAQIRLNGQTVPIDIDGYFTDRSIKTIKIPHIPSGRSILETELPFGQRTAIEWCYLLGNFGVHTRGSISEIVTLPSTLAFESITKQGLPFYSGAVSYIANIETHGGEVRVRLPQYRAAVFECLIDDSTPILGAFAPYTVSLGTPTAGHHRVKITLYISRTNTFGHLHCADTKLSYASPAAWRTSGDAWCYEYRLTDEGLLTAPQISEITREPR